MFCDVYPGLLGTAVQCGIEDGLKVGGGLGSSWGKYSLVGGER